MQYGSPHTQMLHTSLGVTHDDVANHLPAIHRDVLSENRYESEYHKQGGVVNNYNHIDEYEP